MRVLVLLLQFGLSASAFGFSVGVGLAAPMGCLWCQGRWAVNGVQAILVAFVVVFLLSSRCDACNKKRGAKTLNAKFNTSCRK